MNIRYFFGITGVESRQKFHIRIFKFYSDLSKDLIPETIVNSVCWRITNEQHQFYKRCWINYPKSRKRYSKFLIKDLSHPQVYDQIIQYLKTYHIDKYVEYGSILLNLSHEEFLKYEKNRENFSAMF